MSFFYRVERLWLFKYGLVRILSFFGWFRERDFEFFSGDYECDFFKGVVVNYC